MISDEKLSQLLTDGQYISAQDLAKAIDFAKNQQVPLYDAISQLGLIEDSNLGLLISDALNVPLISLAKVVIPHDILEIVPEIMAKKQRVIVFNKDSDGIKLAMSDPNNTEVVNFIAKKTGESVKVYFATPLQIDQALGLYKKNLKVTFDDLLAQQVKEAGKTKDSEAPIIKIVDLLIDYAYTNRASDVHIEPGKKGSIVRFRIDGVLHDVLNVPLDLHGQIVSRVKVASKLRTDEHLSAQDGKMQVRLAEEDLDIRVSIVPIVEGEKIVMRLLSSRSRQFSLSDLGMNNRDLEKIKNGFNKPYGMVLATGPTGSGKTTTIYAILKIINVREINIATIEDPVEYDIEGVNQIQVNPKTNLTFSAGLRAILRQDPNTIFVGEIRDGETASIAVNSAMTGHLVLSTLHTNDAATALPRLLDMQIEPFLVASTVNVIIAQRLVRKICEQCRSSKVVDRRELANYFSGQLIAKYFKNTTPRIYYGKGCGVCHHTGYLGRIGVFEILEVSPEIKDLIVKRVSSDVLKKLATAQGMTTMLEDGIYKIVAGVTTVEEVLRATKE